MYTGSRDPTTEREIVEFDCRVALLDAVRQFFETRGRDVVICVPEDAVEYAERSLQHVAAGLTSREILRELREEFGLPECFRLDVAALLRAISVRGVPC